MNREQIIQMWKDSGDIDIVGMPYSKIEAFAKLVERSVLIEWAKEFAGLGEWACVNRIENELKEKNT